MTRLRVTGASLLPSFPQTLEREGYCANLRQRMVPPYRRASTLDKPAGCFESWTNGAAIQSQTSATSINPVVPQVESAYPLFPIPKCL